MSDYEICEVCGKDHGDGCSCPKPDPKKPWYSRLLDAIGTAIGQAKFGGGGN